MSNGVVVECGVACGNQETVIEHGFARARFVLRLTSVSGNSPSGSVSMKLTPATPLITCGLVPSEQCSSTACPNPSSAGSRMTSCSLLGASVNSSTPTLTSREPLTSHENCTCGWRSAAAEIVGRRDREVELIDAHGAPWNVVDQVFYPCGLG